MHGKHTPPGGMGTLDVADGDELDGSITVGPSGVLVERFGAGLDAKVLVLNKLYMAVRVVSARRAFVLLCKQLAEVIHVEDGKYLTYDFESWRDVAAVQRELERERHDWVRTVRFEIAVPRIIRLLGYDRLPRQDVKLNRRNLFARDRNQCQYCGRHFPTADLSIDHITPKAQGGGTRGRTWCARASRATPGRAGGRPSRRGCGSFGPRGARGATPSSRSAWAAPSTSRGRPSSTRRTGRSSCADHVADAIHPPPSTTSGSPGS